MVLLTNQRLKLTNERTHSPMIHMMSHFLVPALVARLFYAGDWRRAYLLMLATMVVDFDHLVAIPIYDATRCSIGFHPLHQPWFILIYCLLCIHKKTRLFGIGLLIHMLLDSIDCQVTNGVWIQ